MSNRFSNVHYDEDSTKHQQTLKSMYEAIEQYVENNLAAGRAKALIFTHLEESYMWTGKAIRDSQLARDAQ